VLVARWWQQEQYKGSYVMTDEAHLELVAHHQHTRLSDPLFTPSHKAAINTTRIQI
jgi:hypothetical protein